MFKWLGRWLDKQARAFRASVPVIKPFCLTYRNGGGYLQIGYQPPSYFAVAMDSGRFGIMRRTKCESYHDFGQTCYSVDFKFTGDYKESE